MRFLKLISPRKRLFYFLSIVILSSIGWFSIVAFIKPQNDHEDQHREVVFRQIGHQLLLHSGDATSRILPVKKINENTYQLSFENAFGFTPDTLMNLVHQELAKTNLPKNYIVSVFDCHQKETIFAYEINAEQGDLKPCGGREQAIGCYIVQWQFSNKTTPKYAWYLTLLIPIVVGGNYLLRKKKEKGVQDVSIPSNTDFAESQSFIQVGSFKFYAGKNILLLNDEMIRLSEKEAKALNIFAVNIQQVVTREQLMKEIWENEGVFVISRNVDVLVSKLRKKLSIDPVIKITNVLGKGYKLVTDDDCH
jgi:DNA-binding winged helix-turn-helix (wHTH) protein